MKNLNDLHYKGYQNFASGRKSQELSKDFYSEEVPGTRELAKSQFGGQVDVVGVLDYHMRIASDQFGMNKGQKKKKKNRGME